MNFTLSQDIAYRAPHSPLHDASLDSEDMRSFERLGSPSALKAQLPLSIQAAETVRASREAIRAILQRSGPRRLLVIAGPCSIHDTASALEYAQRLLTIAQQVSDVMHVVMRTYFEKPRTTTGWTGLINDPRIDGSSDIAAGLHEARSLLCRLNRLGLPAATEALDPIVPEYIGDAISWYAIGARTVESQTHRQMVSGISAPIGLKNGTDGNIGIAINAMTAMQCPHAFLGIDGSGHVAKIKTQGNPYGHIVLRGGAHPNYYPEDVQRCREALIRARLMPNIMVDCSHDNSKKVAAKQKDVLRSCIDQIESGQDALMGVMLESNLVHGAQQVAPLRQLEYGKSITDECEDIATTERSLCEAAQRLRGLGWGAYN